MQLNKEEVSAKNRDKNQQNELRLIPSQGDYRCLNQSNNNFVAQMSQIS